MMRYAIEANAEPIIGVTAMIVGLLIVVVIGGLIINSFDRF